MVLFKVSLVPERKATPVLTLTPLTLTPLTLTPPGRGGTSQGPASARPGKRHVIRRTGLAKAFKLRMSAQEKRHEP